MDDLTELLGIATGAAPGSTTPLERGANAERRRIVADAAARAASLTPQQRGTLAGAAIEERVRATAAPRVDPATLRPGDVVPGSRTTPQTATCTGVLAAAVAHPIAFTGPDVARLLHLTSTLERSPLTFLPDAILALVLRADRPAATAGAVEAAERLVTAHADASALGQLVAASLAVDGAALRAFEALRATAAPLAARALHDVLRWPVALQRLLVWSELDPSLAVLSNDPDAIARQREEQAARLEDLHSALAADRERVDDARASLDLAAARVDELASGRIPFAADRLFDATEVPAIERASLVLLTADAPDVTQRLEPVLRGSAIAPTEAASAPSQAVASAVARAVAAAPTPEALDMLRAVAKDVRHKGLVKRLERDAKGGAKALPSRGAVALRLPAESTPTAAQRRGFVRALEGQLALGTAWEPAAWHELMAKPFAATTLSRLVVVHEGVDGERRSLVPAKDGRSGEDATGRTTPIDGRVHLWHPADASEDERVAWRSRLWDTGLAQPFRQVLREHYRPADPERETIGAFEGLQVDLHRLLGLAHAEGWRVLDDGIVRRLGQARMRLELEGHIYPGAQGTAVTGVATIAATPLGTASPPAELPAALVSEAMRSIDLLVSVAALSLETDADDAVRLGIGTDDLVAMRRIVLEHRYAAEPRVRIEARRAHVDDHAIHLATGGVSVHGARVELEDPPPLPRSSTIGSDEQLLGLIVRRIEQLLVV